MCFRGEVEEELRSAMDWAVMYELMKTGLLAPTQEFLFHFTYFGGSLVPKNFGDLEWNGAVS